MRLRKKPHTDEKLQSFTDFVTIGDVEPITKDALNAVKKLATFLRDENLIGLEE